MARVRALFLGTIIASLCIGGTRADTVISVSQFLDGQKIGSSTIAVGAKAVRTSSPWSDFIFREDLGKVWFIDWRNKVYFELTRDDFLSSTPAKTPQPATLEKADNPRKIGNWDCAPYHIMRDGSLVEDACFAQLSDLGLTAEDLKSLADYSLFMSHMAPDDRVPSPSPLDFDVMENQIGFQGYPIETSHQAIAGGRNIVTIVESIKHQDSQSETFNLPEGLTRKDAAAEGLVASPYGLLRRPK